MSQNQSLPDQSLPVFPVQKGKLFVVSAPSGAGKTTVVTALITRMTAAGESLERVITYTTRALRLGERDGVDYHFISVSEFECKIKEGFFINWSGAYGNYYGLPQSIIEQAQQGRSFILVLDRAGAQEVLAKEPSAVLVWLYTHTLDILHARLVGRGTDTPDQIAYRLALAQQEYELEKQKPLFHHHILNDFVENAVTKFENIVRLELAHSLASNRSNSASGRAISEI